MEMAFLNAILKYYELVIGSVEKCSTETWISKIYMFTCYLL